MTAPKTWLITIACSSARSRSPAAQVTNCALDSGRRGLPQRALLLVTHQPRSQLLPPAVREEANQPRSQVVSNKSHRPIIPPPSLELGRSEPEGAFAAEAAAA